MVKLNGNLLQSPETAYPYLKEVFSFPAYFGNNLDALYDCLTERPAEEVLIFYPDGEKTEFYGRVLHVMGDACASVTVKKLQVLVVMPVEDRHKALLQAAAPGAEFTYSSSKAVTREQVQSANVIIGNAPAAMVSGSENLCWLQLNSAGTDGYTADGVLAPGTLLTNATGAYGLAISEHLLGSLLYLMKNLHHYGAEVKNHNWQDHGKVTSIYGSKTLVVGYGNIGSEFAMRMHALGSTVTGIRRNKTEKPEFLAGLYQMDALDECLADADIVATCLPGTKETYHVFNAETFAKMKPGAFFLNVGRGNAVDSYALADALNSGHLAGAAVDVTEPEPLPADHPLWDAKNLLITPHVSGGYHLPETHERIIRIAAENLRCFTAGQKLTNNVDFATGYRKLEN